MCGGGLLSCLLGQWHWNRWGYSLIFDKELQSLIYIRRFYYHLIKYSFLLVSTTILSACLNCEMPDLFGACLLRSSIFFNVDFFASCVWRSYGWHCKLMHRIVPSDLFLFPVRATFGFYLHGHGFLCDTHPLSERCRVNLLILLLLLLMMAPFCI